MNYVLKQYWAFVFGIFLSLAASTCQSDIYVKSSSNDWRLPAAQFLDLSGSGKRELITGRMIYIEVSGKIEKGDGKYFTEVVQQFERDYAEYLKRAKPGDSWVPPGFLLNSEGGSVLEAIHIAKSIRQALTMRGSNLTKVLKDDICYSSCVIILAASYKKLVFGDVGIHRPYFVNGENVDWGYNNLQEAYNELYDELSVLFKNWNLSSSLIDDMFQIPSSALRILSEDDLDRYGLNRDDLILEEEGNIRMRAVCGRVFAGWDMLSEDGQSCFEKMNRRRQDEATAKWTHAFCGVMLSSTELSLPENLDCLNKIRVSNGLPPKSL